MTTPSRRRLIWVTTAVEIVVLGWIIFGIWCPTTLSIESLGGIPFLPALHGEARCWALFLTISLVLVVGTLLANIALARLARRAAAGAAERWKVEYFHGWQPVRRPLFILLSVLLLGSGTFAAVKLLPVVRHAVAIDRHARQAALREPAARAEWQEQFGDPDAVLADFTAQQDSDPAVRLIDQARAVGIDMARPKASHPATMFRSRAKRDMNDAIGAYDQAELKATAGPVAPPPEEVSRFLDGHGREIGEIVDVLSTDGPVAWEIEVSRGFASPVPNLTGQLRLQRLLVAEALNRGRLGEETKAVQTFRASWNLNASLQRRPEVLSQLIAVAIARLEVGLARRLSAALDPSEWLPRFLAHDYRASMLKALEVETIWGFRGLPGGSSRWDRASRADYLDMRRTFLVKLRALPVSDGPAPSATPESLREREPLSAGEVVATLSMPNLGGGVRRADRLIVDTELTVRVLEVLARRRKLGHWPTDVSDLERSRMREAHWTFAVTPEGRMAVSLSKQLNWGDQRGWALPLRYEVE